MPYLGAGIGLFVIRVFLGAAGARRRQPSTLRGQDWIWLSAAILGGGIVAPVLLMAGLVRTSAASASLLLNIESVATALVAWFVFRENFDRCIALGMAAIAGGAVVLSWRRSVSFGEMAGPLAIGGACLAWAIDNNLTRKISLSDPVQIAMLKGVIAGSINLSLALARGAALPNLDQILMGGAIGLVGYGVSLVLYVLALRGIGAARIGAYFAMAPFVGALIAIAFLREPLTVQQAIASALMASGLWFHLAERHEHEHEHLTTEHSHRHRHDVHHRHAHGPDDPPGEPHNHLHVHAQLRHSHHHYPDSHHRHEH